MQRILQEKTCQIFLFTHSWNDFCDLSYGKTNKQKATDEIDEYKLLEVYKDKTSRLRPIKNNVEPYKKLFQDIYQVSNKHSSEINDSDLYNTPNSMRRVMEEFLRFKTPSSKVRLKKTIKR